jgi:subfamily B ATP-binding cassette protein HlyB/CyaB
MESAQARDFSSIQSGQEKQNDILTCSCYIAAERMLDGFARKLDENSASLQQLDTRQTLEQLIQIARVEGVRTLVSRPPVEQLPGLHTLLPVIMECRDGRYRIFAGVEESGSDIPAAIKILEPQPDGSLSGERISFEYFQKIWAGGVLSFEQLNTAIICFSLVAREHKIELTHDRLRHEYGLSRDEIPRDTLIRMGKDLGLKTKLLRLDWAALINLKKAYPAIVKLRSGRHLVVAGVGAGGDDNQQEPVVASYDPLAGGSGGHLRLKRQEFEDIWGGEIYIVKRL